MQSPRLFAGFERLDHQRPTLGALIFTWLALALFTAASMLDGWVSIVLSFGALALGAVILRLKTDALYCDVPAPMPAVWRTSIEWMFYGVLALCAVTAWAMSEVQDTRVFLPLGCLAVAMVTAWFFAPFETRSFPEEK